MFDLVGRARRAGILGPEIVTAVVLLTVAVVLGGSSRGSAGNLLTQFAALGALTYLAARRRLAWPRGAAAVAFWLMAAIAALPLLYSVPLPPPVWSSLPGRDIALRSYAAAGIAPPWHSLGLHSGVGLVTALHLLAPIAMFLAVIRLTTVQRWALVYAMLGIVLVAILVGFAQVPGGSVHALHFYEISSINGALGFFPNRNHMATLMLCTMPIAAVAALMWFRVEGDGARVLAVAAAVLFGLAVLCLVATSARAGLVLAAPVLIGCGLLARVARVDSSRGLRAVAIWSAIAVAAAIIAASLALSVGSKLTERVQTRGIVDADRLAFARLTLAATPRFLPVGSGPVTFQPIYAMVEPLDQLRPYYINHAHDDYLEVLLEYGIPGAALLLAALAWFGWVIGAAWFTASSADKPIRCAATIGIVAILLHSSFDYPIRTTTIAVVLAMLAALALAGVNAAVPAVAAERPRRVRVRRRIRIA